MKTLHHTKNDINRSPEEISFLADKRQLVLLTLTTVLLTVAALAIVGTKLFYPFHFLIGVGVYVLSFLPMVRRIYLSRKIWRRYHAYTWSKKFFMRERWRLVFALLVVMLVLSFLTVRPLDEKPFAGLTDAQLSDVISDDLYVSIGAMDYLESTGNELIALVESGRDDVNINEDMTLAFTNFLAAVSFSESLTDKHRYFGTITYRLWPERISSFLISYSLYSMKYEIIHRLFVAVDDSPLYTKILNQYQSDYARGDIYNEMMGRFYTPKTGLRLTAGYIYLNVFASREYADTTPEHLLQSKAIDSISYLKRNIVSTTFNIPNVVTEITEQTMFEAWFPIQKTVATGMGRTILSTRGKGGLITEEQALTMGESMQPGDIMLQRRNWHLSNVGIPGFWTHSALYTGSLEQMDDFFASEFPIENYHSFSEYLAATMPGVYMLLNQTDTDGFPYAVIEAIEPGVVFQSLPKSADADFIAVLRPNLTKNDILESVVRAFSHHQKPYDFDFDFDTRDALVCSELIYDAFLERLPEKSGLSFSTSLVNGRKIVSPLDMANNFVSEYSKDPNGTQLVFVYLLKSDEQEDSAMVGSKADFLESVQWSKFSFFQPSTKSSISN